MRIRSWEVGFSHFDISPSLSLKSVNLPLGEDFFFYKKNSPEKWISELFHKLL